MALHQPSQPSKHWWPRKASTVGSNFRQNKQIPSSIPTPISPPSKISSFSTFDEKRPSSSHVLPSFDKPSSKFDSIVSAIGLKTKKSGHSIVDIQDAPRPSLPVPDHPHPPRIRTASSNNTRIRPAALMAPSPDAAMSSSTSHSWDDPLEPLTPSDPSPRSSFYPSPSLLPSDPFRASSPRQYSALSDKSFLDTQSTDFALTPISPRSSRTSASVNSSFGHNASMDSRNAGSKPISYNNTKGFSDTIPQGNAQARHISSMVSSLQAADSKKTRMNRSATVPSSFVQNDMRAPIGLPLSPTREQLHHVSPLDALARQAKVLEAVASSSATSSPSISTSSLSSHSHTVVGSKMGSTHSSSHSLLRRASSQRLRAAGLIPPTPAPTHGLPPTPADSSQLPSKSLRSVSSTSLFDSSISNIAEDISSLILNVPASSSSDDSHSLRSLSFVHDYDLDDLGPFSRATPSPPHVTTRSKPNVNQVSQPGKDSFYRDFDTPRRANEHFAVTPSHLELSLTPKSLKKCLSQQSLNSRARVDSSASAASSAISVDSTASFMDSPSYSVKKKLPRNIRSGVSNASSPSSTRLPQRAGSIMHSKTEGVGAHNIGPSRRIGNNAGVFLSSPPKKRALFSSNGFTPDRRDSGTLPDESQDWDESHNPSNYHNIDIWTMNDKGKKGHGNGRGSGLGISLLSLQQSISNAFTSALSSPSLEPVTPVQPVSPTVSITNQSMSSYMSHAKPHERLGEHILPPEELLRIEALVDMEPPSPPLQSVDDQTDETAGDDWSQRMHRSRVNSLSSATSTQRPKSHFSQLRTGSSTGTSGYSTNRTTHHFSEDSHNNDNARSGSRHLYTRPSAAPTSYRPWSADADVKANQARSGIAARTVPVASTRSITPPMTGLPPPPRKRGNAIPSFHQYRPSSAAIAQVSPAPISRNNSRQVRKPPSDSSLRKHHSLLKKSSFLNIDDDAAEIEPTKLVFMPEDSFLELEQGKESLDFTF